MRWIIKLGLWTTAIPTKKNERTSLQLHRLFILHEIRHHDNCMSSSFHAETLINRYEHTSMKWRNHLDWVIDFEHRNLQLAKHFYRSALLMKMRGLPLVLMKFIPSSISDSITAVHCPNILFSLLSPMPRKKTNEDRFCCFVHLFYTTANIWLFETKTTIKGL